MRIFCSVVLFSLLSSGAYSFAPTTKIRSSKGTRSFADDLELKSIPNGFDTLTSGLASIARLPFGTIVDGPKNTSIKIISLHDMEGDSDCRMVRERITELDLNVETVIPAGQNSRSRSDRSYEYFIENEAIPRMVVEDETGQQIFVGKDDILGYFTDVFGTRKPIVDDNEEDLKKKAVEILVKFGEPLPSFLRIGRAEDVASCAKKDTPPKDPLILYSYEGNQFCRLVREVLSELDIPYELRSAGKGSPRRAELAKITGGSTQCPFLIDPNTNTQMPESKDIIVYLYKNYANFVPPSELLGSISKIITPVLKPVYKVLAPFQAGSNREDLNEYLKEIEDMKQEIEREISANNVVIYTYSLSPFCTEAVAVLESLKIPFKEISLGKEWVPFLIDEGGAQKRAALGEMTGQTSLPHIFVNGKSVGGLYEGLLPALENGTFANLLGSSSASENEDSDGSFE